MTGGLDPILHLRRQILLGAKTTNPEISYISFVIISFQIFKKNPDNAAHTRFLPGITSSEIKSVGHLGKQPDKFLPFVRFKGLQNVAILLLIQLHMGCHHFFALVGDLE